MLCRFILCPHTGHVPVNTLQIGDSLAQRLHKKANDLRKGDHTLDPEILDEPDEYPEKHDGF
jgi:hypothetical protein